MSEFVIKRDDGTFFREEEGRASLIWTDLRMASRFNDYRKACRCVWERLGGSAGEVRVLRVKFVGKVRFVSVGFANVYQGALASQIHRTPADAKAGAAHDASEIAVELFRKVRVAP